MKSDRVYARLGKPTGTVGLNKGEHINPRYHLGVQCRTDPLSMDVNGRASALQGESGSGLPFFPGVAGEFGNPSHMN